MKYSASAITGIATTLLIDGVTHTFYVQNSHPLFFQHFSPYHLHLRMPDELRQMFLIDEASVLSLDALHAIDRMFIYVTGIDVPFGNTMLFGGDFRQTLHIVQRASNNIISSSLWPLFQHFKLTKNLRVTSHSDNLSTFLLPVGDGDLPLKQD